MTLSTAFLVGPRGHGEASLVAQLDELGLRVDAVDEDIAVRVAGAPPGRVMLVDRRCVAHLHGLRQVLLDPRHRVAVGDGVVSVQARSRPALVAALDALQGRTTPDVGVGGFSRDGDLRDIVAELGPDAGVVVVDTAPLVVAVARDEADAARLRSSLVEVDEEAVRLRQAVKARDGFFTTFFVSRYSPYIARWCARRGITPTQVTAASSVLALVAAALCATGASSAYVAAALVLQASFVLDCVDGQLARYSLLFSRHGSWLDSMADRTKEYAVFAGLAVGSARDGEPVWALAAAALAFQTVRHFLHFGYSESEDVDGFGTSPSTNVRYSETGWSVWLRRTAVLPIGERWLLISVVTALWGPRAVFTVLLVTGGFAFAYAAAGRLRRSRRRSPASVAASSAVKEMLDIGPVGTLAGRGVSLPAPAPLVAGVAAIPIAASLVLPAGQPLWWLLAAAWYAVLVGAVAGQPLRGRFDWTLVPAVRVAEYGFVLAVVLRVDDEQLVVAFALLAVTAYHHYDVVYRRRTLGSQGSGRGASASGHEGRMLTLALVVVLAPGLLGPVMLTMTGILGLINLVTSVRWWSAPEPVGVAEGSGMTHTTTGDTS